MGRMSSNCSNRGLRLFRVGVTVVVLSSEPLANKCNFRQTSSRTRHAQQCSSTDRGFGTETIHNQRPWAGRSCYTRGTTMVFVVLFLFFLGTTWPVSSPHTHTPVCCRNGVSRTRCPQANTPPSSVVWKREKRVASAAGPPSSPTSLPARRQARFLGFLHAVKQNNR